ESRPRIGVEALVRGLDPVLDGQVTRNTPRDDQHEEQQQRRQHEQLPRTPADMEPKAPPLLASGAALRFGGAGRRALRTPPRRDRRNLALGASAPVDPVGL